MALDTTIGGATADSYATLAEALTFHAARNNAAWAASNDTVREGALRRATAFLDNKYRDRWIGLTVTATQALAWPRIDGERNRGYGFTYRLTDINGFEILETVVPQQIKTACMAAALVTLDGTDLEPSLARGGQIKSIAKGLGPLSKAIVYADGAPVVDRHIAIDGLLRGFVTSENTVRLVRA